ncbi:MAG: DUF4124 domain-containing protein [Candidatus Contendobacter sp.]|nr:DUF4124 domain-containing protein [Candidatus Contendobacter sp.]
MNGLKRLSNQRSARLSRSAAVLLLTLPGGLALAADSTVYTWKDAAGRVHYGNHPPENLNAKPVAGQPTERIYTWTGAEGKIHYGPQPPLDTPAKELREDDSSLSTIRSGQLRKGERSLLPQDSLSRP